MENFLDFWKEKCFMAEIYNDQDSKKIKGTNKADTITNNNGNNVSINAGNSNEFIRSGSHNVTVSGGKGNDYFQCEARVRLISTPLAMTQSKD